ncbi:sensor histidine kinase [Larkinella soli]|uniref:sensor histidine kinase n=1 Tax=Larkinella soli TaxID=1770527 RepID=UPI000FFB37F8|nr:ATP-binding protein [Larkinella soli]
MSIKAKISLALTFMFAVILTLAGLEAYYLNQLTNDSQAILKDNYISLEYVATMHRAISSPGDPDALTDFETSLKKQEGNLTEVGEQELTTILRREFERLRVGPRDSASVGRIRQALFGLEDLNRQAMVRKNEVAKETARSALLWLAMVGTFCFLVLFSFIINVPGYIADPLRELTRGIRNIAERNFEERLHFRSDDEFGELARSFNSMAQKLDEYEHSSLAKVLYEKRRIDTLIQIMSEGIIGLDENRHILFANPVACRLLGVEESGLVGRYGPDVAASNDLMRTLIQEVMTGPAEPADDPGNRGILKIFDQGKESYFTRHTHTVRVTRTGEEESEQAGYVIVLENITPYKELDLAKTNFIATISHELKTPLSSIMMSLKLLEDRRVGSLNGEQEQLVGNVRTETGRLLNLTGELLNMAQVESGQIQLNLQSVRPAELVDYAAGALRTPAEEKRVPIRKSLPADLPPVRADPDKASWVLINFISNAVRHSPEGSAVEISVRTVPGEEGVEFRVRDHGPGIRPEHRSRVFDRYFRAPGSNGGTGLGLAISSDFIRSMNGQIGLDTTVTEGAAFYFRLPTAIP